MACRVPDPIDPFRSPLIGSRCIASCTAVTLVIAVQLAKIKNHNGVELTERKAGPNCNRCCICTVSTRIRTLIDTMLRYSTDGRPANIANIGGNERSVGWFWFWGMQKDIP